MRTRMIDSRKDAMLCSKHLMTRKILIIAFVLSVAGNSLSVVWPYIEGETACESNCCRVVRRVESRASMSRLRCLMQCENPRENQGLPQSSPSRSARDSKVVAQVSPAPAVGSSSNARVPHSPARTEFVPTHIYLRIGTLLI